MAVDFMWSLPHDRAPFGLNISNHSSCDGNETLSCNKIRIWPSEIIKMLKHIWTKVIVIMRIKLLFWLLIASKNPCGITCNCWTKTKNELKTELDYFVKQYASGHFSPPCSSQTNWQNHLIMIMLIVVIPVMRQ